MAGEDESSTQRAHVTDTKEEFKSTGRWISLHPEREGFLPECSEATEMKCPWHSSRQVHATQPPFLGRKRPGCWLRALGWQVERQWLKFKIDALEPRRGSWLEIHERLLTSPLAISEDKEDKSAKLCNSLSKHSSQCGSIKKTERCRAGYLVFKTILKKNIMVSSLQMGKLMPCLRGADSNKPGGVLTPHSLLCSHFPHG